MAQKVHQLTQEWYDKLLQELKDLQENQLPATLERLKEAISQWDISENSEYDSAMAEKDLIQSRISEIELMLTNIEIIRRTKKWGEVSFGSEVTFIDDKKREHTIVIKGPGELDVLQWFISFDSPIWVALQGKKKWDTATIKAPSRRYDVKITKVK